MNKKNLLIFAAGILLAVLISAAYGIGWNTALKRADLPVNVRVDTLTIHDTTVVIKPQIKWKYKVRVDTFIMAAVDGTAVDKPAAAQADSVAVEVPIGQVYYKGEDFEKRIGYEAWVSGFNPVLDSLHVFHQSQNIHTYTQAPPPSRWNFSITAGPGIVWDGKGVHGGVGIVAGISYSF